MIDLLKERREIFTRERNALKKQFIAVSKKMDLIEPTNPLYTKLAEEKERITIRLYGKDIENERKIERIQGLIDKSLRDKEEEYSSNRGRDGSKERKWWQPENNRFLDPLKDSISKKIDKIEDSLAYQSLYYSGKATLGIVKGLTKATAFTSKALANALLTKKVDQQRKFGIFKTGGRREGRFNFSNNNLLKRYSKDYSSMGDDFYFLGKGLYNKKIKKGELDASDVIEYLRSQNKTTSEILAIMDTFMDRGLVVSDSIKEMLEKTNENQNDFIEVSENRGFVTGSGAPLDYSNVEDQKYAIFVDQQNKEVLKETLLDFFNYIERENERKDKKKKDKDKKSVVMKTINSAFSSLFKILKWVGAGLILVGGPQLLIGITAALAGALYFYGKEFVDYLVSAVKNWWNGNEAQASYIGDREMDYSGGEFTPAGNAPSSKDYGIQGKVSEIPEYTSSGKKIPEEIRGYIKEASEKYGVDPYRIAARIETESSWRNGLTSGAGAQGLMQFIPSTWAAYGEGKDVMDPRANIMAGAHLMADLDKQTRGNEALAAAYYNYGSGNVEKMRKKYGEDFWSHLPKETRDYIVKQQSHQKTLLAKNVYQGENIDTMLASASPEPIENNQVLSSKDIIKEENKKLARETSFTPITSRGKEGIQQTSVKVSSTSQSQNNKAGIPAPISIPTHLGGAGLDLLNTPIRT